MRLSLRLQITLALALLATLFVVALALQVRGFETAVADQSLLADVRALETRIGDVERRGRGYAAVAPRDYESYYRDVAVIHSQWQQDLSALDESIAAISVGVAGSDDAELRSKSEALATAYSGFRAGLADKLGADPKEPRLEWGAQYIEAEAPALLVSARGVSAQTQAMVDAHLAGARSLTRNTWIGGGLVLLAIGLWFWLRVAGRIGRVAEACRAVAEGSFGQRAPVDGGDELGDLALAFNQLSSRTRVVLGVLDRLPEGASPRQAFELLWDESREYLGHRWQGLIELQPGGRDGVLLHQCEADGVDFTQAGNRFALTAVLSQSGLDRQDSALWPDVRRHTLDQSEGRLLRELSRRNLRTLALVRMRGAEGMDDRLLAFAWADAASEETGVARFLGGLARFLGRTLSDRPRGRMTAAPARSIA
jgi:HAMP domain-containing protein